MYLPGSRLTFATPAPPGGAVPTPPSARIQSGVLLLLLEMVFSTSCGVWLPTIRTSSPPCGLLPSFESVISTSPPLVELGTVYLVVLPCSLTLTSRVVRLNSSDCLLPPQPATTTAAASGSASAPAESLLPVRKPCPPVRGLGDEPVARGEPPVRCPSTPMLIRLPDDGASQAGNRALFGHLAETPAGRRC